jgi:hypothetical protein
MARNGRIRLFPDVGQIYKLLFQLVNAACNAPTSAIGFAFDFPKNVQVPF